MIQSLHPPVVLLLALGLLLTPHVTHGAPQRLAPPALGIPPAAGQPPAPGGTRSGRLFITTLNVRDLSAALRFFTEGLGMRELGRHVPGKGVVEVSLGYGDEPARMGLMLLHREERTTPYERGEWGKVILEVKDLRATTESVARAGGTVVRPPREVASAPVLNAIVEDPDGHSFELVQFK